MVFSHFAPVFMFCSPSVPRLSFALSLSFLAFLMWGKKKEETHYTLPVSAFLSRASSTFVGVPEEMLVNN